MLSIRPRAVLKVARGSTAMPREQEKLASAYAGRNEEPAPDGAWPDLVETKLYLGDSHFSVKPSAREGSSVRSTAC